MKFLAYLLGMIFCYSSWGYLEARSPHHLYFGPEFLGYQLNSSVQNIDVHGTRFFWGFKLGYEYFRPCAIYGGIDLLGTSSPADFQANTSLNWDKSDKGFGNIELRLGYTYARNCCLATSFLGLGTYNVFTVHHHDRGFTESFPYLAGGVRLKYICSTVFDIGINLKVFHSIHAHQKFTTELIKFTERKSLWGGEIGIPLVWHFGCFQKWNFTMEPNFLRLGFKETQNIYGARFLLGYSW